ncbi:hypothetical protein DL95DRAFT_119186 [Leptodontidium sp. 2 PMI_412]|nr:hypothetical protein DL95DRAFT_119186 [Leptodontidium sp. 2 PMI_412]
MFLELRRSLRPSEYMLRQDLATDMCLVLALGAKYSITQVNGTQNEWYTKARLRLLSEDLEDDMWLMRVLTMICIFEIDDDINVSSRFLDAAVSIGLANGFDTKETPLDTVDEAGRCQWLRVWETIRFLNLWFLFLPQASARLLSDSGYFLDTKQPPLVSEEYYDGRLVQMSMSAVSGLLREVVKDRRDPSKGASTFLYPTHLMALEGWHSELPLYLRLRTPSSEEPRMIYSEANDRQKAGIVSTFPQ